ncbi:hypothetical protein HX882_07950 [Pseudomonas gingeri]|uniref:Lipoprotein n=1 Tax=Pseudomonas gingeri TaxID=117681 RepID=A0A7Y7XA02_9PSED|nr:hypothetical protein [Pseudomonas gingeri]NWB95815.1 hypothetical protein [Pseudomonas gingeri]
MIKKITYGASLALAFFSYCHAEESPATTASAAEENQDLAMVRRLKNMDYPSLESFINLNSYKNHAVISVAIGDLNDDQIPDYAVTIGPEDRAKTTILMSTPNKSWRVFDESTASNLSELTIKTNITDKHLHVNIEPIKGGQIEYLFAASKTQMALTNIIATYADGGVDDEPLVVTHTYFNSITGELLYNRTNGHKAPLVKEHVKNPECYFHDFNFDLYFCASNKTTTKGHKLDNIMNPLP